MTEYLGLYLSISNGLYLFVLIVLVSLGQILLKIRDRKRLPPSEWPSVSILVSGKNEEKVIATNIKSLLNLDYPSDKLDIWIVDDMSTDKTAQIVTELIEDHNHIKLISTEGFKTHLKAKARGIAFAAKHAQGEWLFITDADAEVHPKWLKKMLTGVNENTGTIAGMMVVKENSFISILEKMSWAYTNPFAFGAAGYGLSFVCVGPNMAIRTSIYSESGGLEKANFTIAEDLAIFNMSANLGYEALAHNSKETTVLMEPIETFRQILSQQRRWIKGPFEHGWEYGIGVIIVFGFSFLYVIAILLALFIAPKAALTAICFKLLAESSVITIERFMLGQEKMLRYIPILYFYLYFIFLFLPISFIVNRSVSWQGQGYNIEYN